MKVVIQNCVTRRYLSDGDDWCEDTANAKDFGSGIVAIDYAIKRSLPDCQVVLSFNDPKLDVQIPFTESCKKRNKATA